MRHDPQFVLRIRRALGARVAVARWLGTALSLACTPALAVPATFAHYGTPTVDGVEGVSEWTDALVGSIVLPLPSGSANVDVYFMNDETKAYAAFRLGMDSIPPGDEIILILGLIPFGTTCPGGGLRDWMGADATSSVSAYIDAFDDTNASCLFSLDVESGGTEDGAVSGTDEGSTFFFELEHPLDSSDNAHDINAALLERFSHGSLAVRCDTNGDCPQLASLARQIRLVSSTYLFFGDFEFNDTGDWSLTQPPPAP
jgi:hypothetical protein